MDKHLENIHDNYNGEIIDMFSFLQKKKSIKSNISTQNVKDENKSDEQNKIDELITKFNQLSENIEKLQKNNYNNKVKTFIECFSFVLLLFTSFGGAFVYLNSQFSEVNKNIDDCLTEEDIKELRESVEKIELWVEGDINDPKHSGANKRLEKIEEKLNMSPIDITESSMLDIITNNVSMENVASPPSTHIHTLTTDVGEDTTGKKYKLKDIIGKTILLTYKEDDKEVYFLGQINKNFHWDGYCVTNVYNNDGTLNGVCESNFKDGKRDDYKSFYFSDTEKIWIQTDRKCDKKGNSGTSIKYDYKCDISKNFTNTNVRIYDFLYVKDFSNKDNKIMLSYYNGYTSDGVYNDQTGTAYSISYNTDGTIRVLYTGKFENGKHHDDSGNAEEIVFDSSNNINKYFYYKGTFEKGERTGAKPPYDYITQDEINNIIKDKNIDAFLLNWYITE